MLDMLACSDKRGHRNMCEECLKLKRGVMHLIAVVLTEDKE